MTLHTFAIETPAPPHLICSIQTTNNTFIAICIAHLHMAGLKPMYFIRCDKD